MTLVTGLAGLVWATAALPSMAMPVTAAMVVKSFFIVSAGGWSRLFLGSCAWTALVRGLDLCGQTGPFYAANAE